MGIPIPVLEVDADRAHSNICLAADCQCPECRHRHIIRLESAIRQTRRQELHNLVASTSASTIVTGEFNAAAPVPARYIDTRLPDYRFRHSLSPDLAASTATTIMGDYHEHRQPQQYHGNSVNNPNRQDRNRDRDHRVSRAASREYGGDNAATTTTNSSRSTYSTSALLSRRRALGYRGPPLTQIMSSSSVSVSNFLSPMMGGMRASREPFTTSPTSMIVDQEQEQEQNREIIGTGHIEQALEAASLEDLPPHLQQHHQPHQQLQYLYQSSTPQTQRPPPSSPLMRMRARAQEWASRVEGVDYYHDSDPEDLQGGATGGERVDEWTRRHVGGSHRDIIMDRHERSSSDVGIEQSTIR